MTKEKQFYNKLRDLFVGAKVEGESGFVNLMRIKSGYFEKGVSPKLQEDVEKVLKDFPEFRKELFDKLYSFFTRYFSESGSIYFNFTPLHQDIYEKVYTDEKDVILFWKTHMLYYVKTDRIFNSIPVEFDGLKFYFDASTIELKKANEKKDLIFELDKVKEDKTIVFKVFYSERGRKTKQDEILKEIRKNIKITEEQLERAFKVFEKQSEVDYFINKNAKEFLREQFDLWLYQYVFKGESKWTEKRIKQLQALKDIAFKIIDFISQFEDELVKIWNKPKFVRNSNYVITLDRIADKKLIEKIKKHKNYSEQVKEWKELGIDKDNPKAPIDTKYFKDLELEILSQFDDLDKSLDGWLIKSENYQALNTILPKFKEKVQTIYIDPPFNLGTNADYFYNVNYKDSNWATLLENRLRIAKEWLIKKGSIFVRCDYNGNWIVRCLMDDIFDTNFINEINVGKTAGKKKTGLSLSYTKDNLFLYAKNFEYIINETTKETYNYFFYKEILKTLKKNNFKDVNKLSDILLNDLFWVDLDHRPGERLTNKSRKLLGIEFEPPKGRHWIKSQEKLDQLYKEGKARLRDKVTGKVFYREDELNNTSVDKDNLVIQVFLDTEIITDNWTDINGYSQASGFQTENSEILLKRAIETASNKSDLILDFFLGSGTTTAVAHKLERKWIGVEMGEHFYTVVLPRMKKVLAYDKSGISKEVKEYQGGGFFKYYELEQYEDTLRNVKYQDSTLFDNPAQDPYNQYIFLKDKKMLNALEVDLEKNKVKVNLEKLYPDIDIAETLSNLLGKYIKKITADEVEFKDGEKVNIKDLNYKLIKPLIWW